MFKFVDANMAIGIPNSVSGWRAYEPQQIKKVAADAGIVHGFAYHNSVLDLHPIEGNSEMDCIAACEPFFSSVWAVLPNHTGEFYDSEELKRRLDLSQVEMVRVFPRYNSHSFSLADWCSGEMLSMLEKRGTPVLIDQEQVDWETIHKVCSNHPRLKVILTTMYYRHARYVFALMKTHKHLYIDTSGMKSFGLLQSFCEQVSADRIVFGTNMGTFAAGSSVCIVNYALISDKEKDQISSRTLESLLEREIN